MNERGEPLSLNITVDGKYLLCEEDVYCYFGEEVYGVLGYLGYNFNAFADVLRDLPLKVKWINFQYSKDNFESKEDLMCAEKTGGFNLVNYRHSSGVYHEQETEDLHRRI